MFTKSGLFLFLLTAFQVSARYKAVESTNIEDEINPEHMDSVSSSLARIVSGWEAQPGQFPYHVALRTVPKNGDLWRFGGAIVSNEWVVSVAQLSVDLVSVSVRVGLSFSNPDNIYEVTEWYIHPAYNNLSTIAQPNDIALLKLQRPVVYTNLVKPIRIQPSADAYRNYNDEQVYISGHGRIWTGGDLSDTLKWVYLRAISNSECSRTFTTSVFTATTICARYYNVTSQSPCNGDFGAPLVHVGTDGVPTLIGVFSFRMSTSDACHSGLPFGYVRPGPYLSWFEEVTGIDFENLQEEQTTTTTTTTTLAPTTTTTPITTTITTPTTTPTTTTPTTTTPTTTTTTTTAPTTTTTTTTAPTTTTTTTTAPTTTTTTTTAPTTTTTTTTAPTPTTTISTTPTTPTPTTPTPTTTTTITTPIYTTTPSTTTTPTPTTTTTELITIPTTEAGEQTPDVTTPEGDATAPPEDSGEGDDSDSSESDKDDDMAQLLKRLQVLVKVKVRMDKYNSTKAVGVKADHYQH